MSNPDNAATQQKQNTFETKINEIVETVKKDDEGKYILPENVTEEVEFAVKSELRRRDTQTAFTKSKQELSKIRTDKDKAEAKLTILADKVSAGSIVIPEDKREHLETLKEDNPEAWRQEMNKIESEQMEVAKATLSNTLTEAEAAVEKANRERLLTDLKNKRPDLNIDDEYINNEVPPRYVKELEDGKISFEQFLSEVEKFAPQGAKIATDSIDDTPNLGKTPGGSKPEDSAQQGESELNYEDEIY